MPRGTREFLQKELKHAEVVIEKAKQSKVSNPKMIIQKRAEKELEPFFHVLSNKKGEVGYSEISELIPLAAETVTRKSLEKLRDYLLTYQFSLNRRKFLQKFTDVFYVRPLLGKIRNENEILNQVKEEIPLLTTMKTYMRRNNFKTLHKRYDTDPDKEVKERKRRKRRTKIAKNMLHAAKVTQQKYKLDAINLAFKKHSLAAEAGPELDGIEDFEHCVVHFWSYDDDTEKGQCVCVYNGGHGVHKAAASKTNVRFTTSYGDLLQKNSAGIPSCNTGEDTGASPLDVSWGRKIREIAMSDSHCAIISNHRIYTWGDNNANGALGHPRQQQDTEKMTIPDPNDIFKDIKEKHFLNVGVYRDIKNEYDTEHTQYCAEMSMASDGYDFLIEHPLKAQTVWKHLVRLSEQYLCRAGPRLVSSLSRVQVKGVACSNNQTLALGVRGQIYSWGTNYFGSLGLGSTGFLEVLNPTRIKTFDDCESRVKEIACGERHCVAVLEDGKVFSWGCCSQGQLGHENYVHSGTPTLVKRLCSTPVLHVSVGDSHNIALTAEGSLWSWGSNWQGQLGRKIVLHQKSLEETLKRARERLEAISEDTSQSVEDEVFESRMMDPSPKRIILKSYHGSRVIRVDSKWNGNCAVTQDDKLLVWGETINVDPHSVFNVHASLRHDLKHQHFEYSENHIPHEVEWRKLFGYVTEDPNDTEHGHRSRLLRTTIIGNGLMIVTAQLSANHSNTRETEQHKRIYDDHDEQEKDENFVLNFNKKK